MPTWLQIIGAVLGAIGSFLGSANMWLQWREKRERLTIFCASHALRTFRVFNPTSRPVEIRSIVFETWNQAKRRWIEQLEDTELPNAPFMLPPLMSHDFTLSSSQSLALLSDKGGRLRVKTGSNAEYEKRITAS